MVSITRIDTRRQRARQVLGQIDHLRALDPGRGLDLVAGDDRAGLAATTVTSTPKSLSFFSIRRLVISSVSGETVEAWRCAGSSRSTWGRLESAGLCDGMACRCCASCAGLAGWRSCWGGWRTSAASAGRARSRPATPPARAGQRPGQVRSWGRQARHQLRQPGGLPGLGTGAASGAGSAGSSQGAGSGSVYARRARGLRRRPPPRARAGASPAGRCAGQRWPRAAGARAGSRPPAIRPGPRPAWPRRSGTPGTKPPATAAARAAPSRSRRTSAGSRPRAGRRARRRPPPAAPGSKR